MENKVEIKVESKKDLFSELLTLRKDIAREQKRGLHFISASVVIWGLSCAFMRLPCRFCRKTCILFAVLHR